jgi:WD40 repeat protein
MNPRIGHCLGVSDEIVPVVCFCMAVFLVAPVPAAWGQATGTAAHLDREGFPLPAEAVARLGSARLRHLGSVHGLAYSRDGKQIISLGADDRVCVWDAASGKLLRATAAILGTPYPLAVRVDDKAVDVIAKGFLYSFDPQTGKALRKLALSYTQTGSTGCFSPDGAWCAHDRSLLNIAAATTGKNVEWLPLNSTYLAFTPDSKRLAVRGDGADSMIEFIDLATRKRERSRGLPASACCWFAPDSRCLIGDSVWDPKAGKRLATLSLPKDHMPFGSVAFSPDSRLVAVPDWWDTVLYETATGKELRRLPTGPDSPTRPYVPVVSPITRPIAFAPDGKRLVVGNHAGQISQWDVSTGKPLRSADPIMGSIRVCRWINRDQLLVENEGLAVYDRKTGECVRRFPWEPDRIALGRFRYFANAHGVRVTIVAQLSADGTVLAVPGPEEGIELRDARNGKLVRKLGDKIPMPAVLAFARDGKRLYSSTGDFAARIHVWDLATGKLVREIEGRSGQYPGSHAQVPLEYIAVSADSRLFATAGSDCDATGKHWLRVWDARTGELVYQHGFSRPLSRHCTFTPTGELLAVLEGPDNVKENTLTLVEPHSGTRRWTLSLNDSPRTTVASVALSADGQNLAVGDSDGRVALYEAATGRIRHVFHGHRRPVDGLAFTPDGALLAASSADAPVFLWDVYRTHDPDHKLTSWAAAEAPAIWKNLGDANAERAFQTIRRLMHHPHDAVALLRERLYAPLVELDKPFRKLLRELDSDDFNVRERAYTELARRADEFEFQLQRAATENLALEVRRRLAPLNAKVNSANPERLRRLRALEALRQMTTPEAQRLLKSLRGS